MRDNIRRGDSRTFAKSEVNSLKVPCDAVVKALMLDVTINLSTAGGGAAATTPRSESPWNIIRSMYLDFDGKSRFNVSGAILKVLEQYKLKVSDLPSDTVAAPAAGATGSIRFLLPLNFGLPLSNAPAVGLIDMSKYNNVYINLTMGDIGNLFTTVNDTTITSIDVNLYVYEVMGAEVPQVLQNVFVEPIVITENVLATNTDHKIELPIGDRDYLMMLIRQETALDTPANTVISGAVEVKGSAPQVGIFQLRKYNDITVLRNFNKMNCRNNAMPTGYAMLDFILDGNLQAGKIGTQNLTDWAIHASVTGAGGNKVNVAALVLMRG